MPGGRWMTCWAPEEVPVLAEIASRACRRLQQPALTPVLRHMPLCAQDEQLRGMVKLQGACGWKIIAKSLPGKTAIQCLHRWKKVHGWATLGRTNAAGLTQATFVDV
jgi:hypothetical protein